jgi:murein DD-endopeptidase MepM/ murein hydrolase activator NlpD
MLKKKLTFLLIPDSQGTSKQFSIPVIYIYGSLAGIVLLLLVSFFLSAAFVDKTVSEEELSRLRTENQQLQEKYERVRWDLAEIDTRYNDLIEKEIAIRTIFDLPEIDAAERQLGVGGPASPTYPTMSETEKVAFKTEVEVDRLLRLSHYELEKYEEVEDLLNTYKDRLDHTPSIWPAKGWYSSGYGMRQDPFTGYRQFHQGIDISNHMGTSIFAPADGVVKHVGKVGSMGKMITIDHGYGFITRYGHLSNYEVKKGERVKRGDLIGLMGSSGRSTGPHLHFEVWRNGKPVNPMNFILNKM